MPASFIREDMSEEDRNELHRLRNDIEATFKYAKLPNVVDIKISIRPQSFENVVDNTITVDVDYFLKIPVN